MLNIIGDITPPGWLTAHGETDLTKGNFGLINFASSILKLIMVLAGLFAFLNLILAGLAFISSAGDPETIKKANAQIVNSIIGLVIIAASFIISALFGLLLFGDPFFILKPKLYGVGL